MVQEDLEGSDYVLGESKGIVKLIRGTIGGVMGEYILDLGCGGSYSDYKPVHAMALSYLGARVVGIDKEGASDSETYIHIYGNLARERVSEILGKLENQKFDAVICSNLFNSPAWFEAVEDAPNWEDEIIKGICKETYDLLVDGGVFIIPSLEIGMRLINLARPYDSVEEARNLACESESRLLSGCGFEEAASESGYQAWRKPSKLPK
ncbi:MAG: class I SAM-dependent methyltransferase [archaeon]